MKAILVTAVCLLSYSGTIQLAQAADYYVSASGNDANTGVGPSGAWRTISKVNSMRFAPGDRILFQGSATFPGQIYFGPGTGGTASAPITITSYGTGKAIVDAGTGSAGFYAWNTAGIDIDNVIFKANSFGLNVTRATGILFYNDLVGNVQLPRIRINNVEVYGFGAVSVGGLDSAGYPLRKGGEGISIGGWNGTSGYSDIRITNTVVHDNEGTGVAFWGPEVVVLRNIYISGLDSYRNTGRTPSPAEEQFSGGGLLLYNVSNAIVDQSKFHENGTNGNGCAGLLIMESDHVTVQNSQAYLNHTGGHVDGNGFDIDGGTTDSVLQYNYSYRNDGAGYLFAQPANIPAQSRNTIRYNISENDGGKYKYGSIHFWNGGAGGISEIEIYNNTIYSDPASGGTNRLMYFLDFPVTNLRVRNNIFVTAPGASVLTARSVLPVSVFQYNNYWTRGASLGISWGGLTYTTLAAWSAASGQESIQPMSLDPLFVSAGGGAAGYKLSSTSPLIDKGTALILPATFAYSAPTRDYFGSSIPIDFLYDIGASETTVGTTPPPLPAKPVINSFSASPTSITAGGSATLAWNVSNATSISITPSIGAVASVGSVAVSPAATTSYTLAASNGVDTVNQVVTVSVSVNQDSTPPSATITSPASRQTVSGIVTIAATVTDNVKVASVRFQLDGVDMAPAMTSGPYTLSWNANTTTSGSHTISVIARDAAGNSSSASIPIKVRLTKTGR